VYITNWINRATSSAMLQYVTVLQLVTKTDDDYRKSDGDDINNVVDNDDT